MHHSAKYSMNYQEEQHHIFTLCFYFKTIMQNPQQLTPFFALKKFFYIQFPDNNRSLGVMADGGYFDGSKLWKFEKLNLNDLSWIGVHWFEDEVIEPSSVDYRHLHLQFVKS